MAVSNKMKIPVGTVLAGKYRITREIGRGGMATVHEAENIDIGKRIAIKVLAQELTGSSIVVERFLREARAAAAIRSPYICDVYDSGKLPTGQPFLVLELLEGESLYERMTRQRQLDVPTTVQVITQVCRGLTKAHAASIVHRDLKPENIFLTKDEEGQLLAKILDFGLAKFYTPTTKDQTRLTREGAVFGTPAYMSPEQVRGQGAVDHRADLWALGCITYECFTGKTVWSTDQGVAMTFAQIASAPLPRPARYRPDLPPAFTEWFDRTLDRDINKRFQTAKEFAEALAVSCGLDRREASEIRSSPIDGRAEAAAALAAPQGPPPSPRLAEPNGAAAGHTPQRGARIPPPAPPPPPPPGMQQQDFQPFDDGSDGDGDPTRVLTKKPLVKPLESGPRAPDDPRMERFRRGPDGKIAKVVPQVAPNAPPVPSPLTPLPGSHRPPGAHAAAHGPASRPAPASQRPPPHPAQAPHPPRPRPAHHPALELDSEIVKNPFVKARRRQRIILVITLLVIAVVVALLVALSLSPSPTNGATIDTSAAPGTATAAATGTATVPTAATSKAAPATAPQRKSALPAWLSDVREAQAPLASGDVRTAAAKLGQATSKSNQHAAAQGLAKQVASAIWVRGACTLAGIARPRTYDLADASTRRVAATRPSVVASGKGALAAWTDAHAGASHAYVARLDGAFAINEAPIDLTPDGGDVQRVELAAWGDKVVALYTQARSGVAGTYARWIGPDGKPSGQPVQVAPAKSAQGSPSIIAVPGRAIYAVWSEDGDRDSEDVFVQKLSQSTLSPEGASVRLTDLSSSGAARARALAPRGTAAKEALHLAFELERKPASFIEHQTVPFGDLGRELSAAGANREGKVAGALALVNIDKGRAYAPQVACSSELCFVVYHGGSPPGAHGAAFDAASGKPVWRRTFSPFADYPAVTASPAGGVLAAWVENGKVVVAPLGRAGYSRTAKVGRAQGDQPALSLAPGAEKGQYFAAWLDMEASQPEPYVARLACP